MISVQQMSERQIFLLGKMIGLLGSDQDGEILAAVRQMRRLLESNKMSFGDLVNMVQNSNGAPAPAKRGNQFADMAWAILENEDMLRDHELRFAKSMYAHFLSDPNYKMTEKQARWFSYLYAEYGNV